MKYFLADFPPLKKIAEEMKGFSAPPFRDVNCHIHTPHSFSAFSSMDTIFRQSRAEEVRVLGINDLLITDGYEEFLDGCQKNRIFPLFNVGFTGLMKHEKQNGIRINDRHSNGKVFLSGKGLDFPFSLGIFQKLQVTGILKERQNQIKSVISRINELIPENYKTLRLTYADVRQNFARNIVHDRHIARALRIASEGSFASPNEKAHFFELLYGGKSSMAEPDNSSALENEIHEHILSTGGRAYIEESEKTLMELSAILKIITSAGGIPCYPVLLDDQAGNLTEFEASPDSLHQSLQALGIGCIEFFPRNNDIKILTDYVRYFDEKDYIITFGTGHSAPGMSPLKVTSKGSEPLGEYLQEVAWEGACVIAAHQYLRADGRQGYVLPDGKHSSEQKAELAGLGRLIIEYYLNKSVFHS